MPRVKNKTYEEQRGSRIRSYGISVDQYNYLFKIQKGVCYICQEKELKKSLGIDHDHKTGKVRGLLCSKCNTAIGLLKDDPELLTRAQNYLTRENNWLLNYNLEWEDEKTNTLPFFSQLYEMRKELEEKERKRVWEMYPHYGCFLCGAWRKEELYQRIEIVRNRPINRPI